MDSGHKRVLALRPTGNRPPLFCLPPVAGLSWPYSSLVRALETSQPIYGLQASGVGRDTNPIETVDEIISDYISIIRSIRPNGPYQLLGWSFGGVVAHSIACRLQDAGDAIPLLAILDSYPSMEDHTARSFDREASLRDFATALQVRPAKDASIEIDVLSLIEAGRRAGHFLSSMGPEDLERMLALAECNASLMSKFSLKRFAGDILLFRAAFESADGATPDLWRPYLSGDLIVHRLPCRHSEMGNPDMLELVGKALSAYSVRNQV